MDLTSVKEVFEFLDKNIDKRCFLYFVASPDETGESWCPDCRKAKPFVESAIEHLPEDAVFITVHTGSKPVWKDQANEFRTEPKLNVNNVPTLMEFGKPNRLVEDQLFEVDQIVNFLTQ
nr:thioredoxin domain containing protein 17 [Hymenolepis microstoma]